MPEHANWIAMKPKVSRAFKRLTDAGIAAKTSFTDTLSDGAAEIGDGSERGFAFYHKQDAARARRDGVVCVAFGSRKRRAKPAEIVAIGREVRDALEKEGLFVEWNEEAKVRLVVHRSKAAHDRAVRAAEAEEAKEHKQTESRRKTVDLSAITKKVTEAIATLGDTALIVPTTTFFAREKAILAKAKKAKRFVVGVPSFGESSLVTGEETIFIWGYQVKNRAQAFALARKIKSALVAAGIKKAACVGSMVKLPVT